LTRLPEFDEVGYWSEVKLDILKEYASAYSRILTAKKLPHIYIDAFAGAGRHISKSTGEVIAGSPQIAIDIEPPFREFHLIDLSAERTTGLRSLFGDRANVFVYSGDANRILSEQVFPTVKYESYRRALCLLDPYGLQLHWSVIFQAGQLRTIDMFLNFPVMDINRNVLWRDPERVTEERRERLNAFWGDESWRRVAYSTSGNFFGEPEKETNEVFAEGFRRRLIDVAGFKRVPPPIPMRNSNGVIVYYLFFASQVDVAERIVLDIFNKYRNSGRN
jgi:three-Cys-motif partner protein